MESFWLVVFSRVLFGMGGENMITCQMVCAEKWFKGRLLSVAMGLNMISGFIGTTFNNLITPMLVAHLEDPFKVSVCVSCIVSMSTFGCFTYFFLNESWDCRTEPKKSETNYDLAKVQEIENRELIKPKGMFATRS
jgi:nitrate/nitrite transporter NarK